MFLLFLLCQCITQYHYTVLIFLYRQELEEADEFCPHCDNQFVIAAKTPAEPVLAIESDDPRVIRDPRMRGPTDAEIEELLLA